MTTRIGSTLRDERMRQGLDLAQVEAATKIRVRYLRALENEEWDVLPGGSYTRGFVRTYANHLGLDGERLSDELRTSSGDGLRERYPKADTPRAIRRRSGNVGEAGDEGRRMSPGLWAAAITALLIGVLIAIGLASRDDEPAQPEPSPREGGSARGSKVVRLTPPGPAGHALALRARREVWVCVLNAAGRPLVDGEILEAGASEGPFRSSRFTLAFGNGEILMTIDGKRARVPRTSSPVGYRVTSGGGLSELPDGQRPDCT